MTRSDHDDADLGTLSRDGAYYRARLVRELPHDVRTVWEWLTQPHRFVQWLAPGEIEARTGGSARLDFTDSGIVIDSTVTAYRAPTRLEYSWSGPGEPPRPVRWDLNQSADGARLTLTLDVPAHEDVARACAGWEAHLMMLLAAIEGIPIKFPFERFQSTRQAYRELIESLDASKSHTVTAEPDGA